MLQYLFVGIIRGNVSVLRSKKSKNNIFDRIMQIIMNIKKSILYYGSSGKCVDTFRIALTEEPKLCIIQKHSQDGLGYLLYYHPPMQKTFSCQYFEKADDGLKNHDIISDKTPTDKGKNTCKKQVCNQQ